MFKIRFRGVWLYYLMCASNPTFLGSYRLVVSPNASESGRSQPSRTRNFQGLEVSELLAYCEDCRQLSPVHIIDSQEIMNRCLHSLWLLWRSLVIPYSLIWKLSNFDFLCHPLGSETEVLWFCPLICKHFLLGLQPKSHLKLGRAP